MVAIRMSLEIFVLTFLCSHRSPDGGGFPGDVHRLAAGGYGREWLREGGCEGGCELNDVGDFCVDVHL